MRAVILQHEEHEDEGLLGPALKAAGFEKVRRFRSVEREDLEAECVLVLGGSMGVYEDAQHPFLAEERAFLSERLALERPTLGICLGAQLLAAAAGAEVSKGKNGLELGIGPVRWMKAAQDDAVFKGVPAKSTVAHWHQDTFAPVPGAALLASTDRYSQQAFRLGQHSYGLQFHLELTATMWSQWLEGSAGWLTSMGKDVEALKKEAGKLKAAEAANAEWCQRLAFFFAKSAGR